MIRLRITRRRWTPEDIEAGGANDPGEAWDELFEDVEEVEYYLYHRYASHITLEGLREAAAGADRWMEYVDDGDTLETIEGGGCVVWTVSLA